MSQHKIYLAGPEVLLSNAVELGLRKKMLCEEFGFVGLFPLDNDFEAAAGEKRDEKIFAANVALMRQSDAGIFNLSPLRGVNADPGTSFELGFFTALDRPVFAYSNCAEAFFERVSQAFGAHSAPDGAYCDSAGLDIEHFGNADNLMLDAALKAQGKAVLRPEMTGGLDRLDGFTACLRQARLHFGF